MSVDTSLPTIQLQRGIYTLLNGVITGGVYDKLPASGPSFPYTEFSSMETTPMEARNVKGMTVIVTLITYSKNAGGNEEVTGIQKSIIEKLTASRVAMTGFTELQKTLVKSSVGKMPEEAGTVYRAITSFNYMICKT